MMENSSTAFRIEHVSRVDLDLILVSPDIDSIFIFLSYYLVVLGGPVVERPSANAGDRDSIPGLGIFYMLRQLSLCNLNY